MNFQKSTLKKQRYTNYLHNQCKDAQQAKKKMNKQNENTNKEKIFKRTKQTFSS